MDEERERPCLAPELPAELDAFTDGYAWACSTVGESGGAVYRLHGHRVSPDLYLKHGRGTVAADVADEMARLRWLARHVPVPEVVHFTATPRESWLLMTALPGKTAYQILEGDPEQGFAVVDALAGLLKQLHAIPAVACPFNSSHTRRLLLARQRIDAGLVDEDDFDEARDGWSAEDVWQALQSLLPLATEPVVTHGDFSLDNILIGDGKVTGCIDVGRVGIADRYQDIAIAWNCLEEFGPELQDRFVNFYGLTAPDAAKLQFHLLLDELF